MRLEATPPASRHGPPPSSKAAIAITLPTPLPSADQLVPSHLAIPLAGTPPMVKKLPAAWSAAPPPSSKTPSTETFEVVPLPSGDQLVPSQRAIEPAGTPPATEKEPPA